MGWGRGGRARLSSNSIYRDFAVHKGINEVSVGSGNANNIEYQDE